MGNIVSAVSDPLKGMREGNVRCMLVGKKFAGQRVIAQAVLGVDDWEEARDLASQMEEDYDPRRQGNFIFPGIKTGSLRVSVWDYRAATKFNNHTALGLYYRREDALAVVFNVPDGSTDFDEASPEGEMLRFFARVDDREDEGETKQAELRGAEGERKVGGRSGGVRSVPLLVLAKMHAGSNDVQQRLLKTKLEKTLLREVAEGKFSSWKVVVYNDMEEQTDTAIVEGFEWLNKKAREGGAGLEGVMDKVGGLCRGRQ